MPLILALLLLAGSVAPLAAQGASRVAAQPPSQSRATVSGQVRSDKTNAPLPFAVVELVGVGPQPISAVADSNGLYVLRDVPVGRRLLRATHLDHAANEIELVILAERRHYIDFDLAFRPLRLSPVTAEGSRGLTQPTADTASARDADLGPTNVRVLESSPSAADLGLADAARDIPGHEPVDPADVLYVRGGSADLKLVTLNGAPVYAPFHIGGLINALDADVLSVATLHIGGAPARYDGGLSYILELETRAGRRVRPTGVIGMDLISSRALLETPVGDRTGMLVSARTIHGRGTRSLMSEFPYGYGDVLARVDREVGMHGTLTATAFWNHESVALDSIGNVQQTARWGNHAGSVRYRGDHSGTQVLATLSGGQFRTILPLGGIRPLLMEGTVRRGKAALDMQRALFGMRMNWGVAYEKMEFEHRAYGNDESRESDVVRSVAGGDVTGAYIESAYSPTSWLRLRGGLRADHFSRGDVVRLAPRAAATVMLTDRASITLSGGKYHQYVREPERSLVFLGNAVPDSSRAGALIVAEATHLVLGLAQDFPEGIRLGLDGYFKQFEGLASSASATNRTASSGVDLWVRRNTGRVTGWLGYSLGWVWAIDGNWIRPTQSFSGRHIISAGVLGPLAGRGAFDVRVSYGAGLPYTAIPEPEPTSPLFSAVRVSPPEGGGGTDPAPLPGEPNEPYIRLDAQVSRTFDGSIRTFEFKLMPYIKVINALNRRDAIFYHYNRDVGHAEPLADLPIVPIIGFEWKF